MRRGVAKSCKNGLGRDNEIYFGRRITTNFRVGLGRRNNELNGLTNCLAARDNEINFWRRITTNFMDGLGRRNNELNELTNFLGGEGLGRSTVAHFARKVRGTDMSRTCLKYIVDYAAPLPLKGAHIPG